MKTISTSLALMLCVATHLAAQTTDNPLSPNTELQLPASQPPVAKNSARYVDGGGVIITWSESGDTAWGFSRTQGKWTKHAIDASRKVSPLVAGKVAAIQHNERVYAYSGETGQWDALRLEKGVKAELSVDDDLVLATAGEDIYTFAAGAGRWTSPDGTAVNEGAGDASEIRITRVFALQHIMASDAAKIVNAIMAGDTVKAVAEPTGNSLIVSANERDAAVIEALLLRLDEPSKDAPAMSKEAQYRSAAEARTTQSINALAAKYEALDSQAAALAEAYRRSAVHYGPKHSQLLKLKADLENAVENAFDVRQQLHQAKLELLQMRIEKQKNGIASRHRIKNDIVAKRVDELLRSSSSSKPADNASAQSVAGRAAGWEPVPRSPRFPSDGRMSVRDITFTRNYEASLKKMGFPLELQVKQMGRMQVDREGMHFAGGRVQIKLGEASELPLRAAIEAGEALLSPSPGEEKELRLYFAKDVRFQSPDGVLATAQLLTSTMAQNETALKEVELKDGVEIQSGKYVLKCDRAQLTPKGAALSGAVEIVRVENGEVTNVISAENVLWDVKNSKMTTPTTPLPTEPANDLPR